MQRQVFASLCRETVNQIGGCFDFTFWARDVLLATQVSPAVWHAGLALAAMDYRRRIPVGMDTATRERYYTFSLMEYNKSIQQLIILARHTHSTSFTDQQTILISNALLFGLCCLQGRQGEAAAHARSSIELFYRWRFWEHSEISGISVTSSRMVHSDSLIALIMNFECQFVNRLSYLISPAWLGDRTIRNCSPVSFNSITDAYLEFLPLLVSFMDATREIGSPTDLVQPRPDIQRAYRREFSLWKTKFDSLLRLQKPVTLSDLEGMAILSMYFTTLEIGFKIDLEASQLAYDACDSLFESIITQAEKLYEILSTGTDPKTSAGFSFALPLAEVFIYTVVTCRNTVLRHRLMKLIRKWPQYHGLWNSKFTTEVCEAVIQQEESWTSTSCSEPTLATSGCYCLPNEFTCDNHRVRDLDTYFTRDREARVFFRTVGDLRANLPGKAITVTW